MVLIDLGLGERKSMTEMRDLIKSDPMYHNLTKEQEEEMKNEVLAFCNVKKKVARMTNKSSAQDYRRVCGNMEVFIVLH
jgi:ABC-type polysaccharide/polyol phosphate transport system ATPase subunit